MASLPTLPIQSASTTNSTTGLGAGIDVASLVTSILAPDQQNITNIQNQVQTLGIQDSAYSSIESDLSNLLGSVNALADFNGQLNSKVATSSNTQDVTATADNTASIVNHIITVDHLASTSAYYTTTPVTDGNTTINGSFTIAVGGGSPTTISTGSGQNTLNTLASYINEQNLGVSASVINDANGARLSLVSNASGLPGNITITNATGDLALTQASAGINAGLTIDGIPVSSATDTVTGALTGVTLNLLAPTNGSQISLGVTPDTNTITSAIQDFVTNYNTLNTDINAQFTYNTSTGYAGPLAGDVNLRQVQTQLLSDVSSAISGNNGIVNLASVGVNLNDDGSLTLDTGALNTALGSNYNDVINLFQSTSLNGIANKFSSDLQTL